MSQPPIESPPPPADPHPPGPPRRRISSRLAIGLVILALAVLHAVSRIIAGDIRGQFELIAIVGLFLFVALPTFFLARLLAKSHVGLFIHADPRTTTLVNTKRFKLVLRDEQNSLLVVQGFVLLLFLIMLGVVAIGVLLKWLTS